MKKLISTLIFTIALTSSAYALDLKTARTQGLVAEGQNGYVIAISKSAEAGDLAKDVNEKRKAEYARISKENGQGVDVVAKVAAEEIIKKLPAGAKYQDASGKLVTK